MKTWTAQSSAAPERAWELMARPGRWHEWAPHVRGAWGLGSPEVEEGALGMVRLLGLVPVPARIVAKEPGRYWSWRVGPVLLVHSVHSRPGGGSEVAVDLLAPGPIETALGAAYGPVIAVMVKRLARMAASAG